MRGQKGTDYLGSICAVMDHKGNYKSEYSYDAWGRRRDKITWEVFDPNYPATDALLFDRGYTGHEHLDDFGLINMNGRMYDPVLGKMLGVDNYNNQPYSVLGFNRYSYAGNNPLKFTDPDGQWINLVIGAVVGGVSGYIVGERQGHKGFSLAGDIFMGAGIGAISAGFGGAVGGAVGSSTPVAYGGLAGTVAGSTVSGSISGMGMTAMAGGNGIDGAWKGAFSGFSGGLVGGYISGPSGAFVGGAISGATSTALSDGDFSSIAISAGVGGIVSYATYEAEMAVSYSTYKSNGGSLTKKQFYAVSRAAQKSFARGREYGGWLTEDGDYVMDPTKGGRASNTPGPRPSNASGRFHTHPNWGRGWRESFSDTDEKNVMRGYKVTSYVVGRQNAYRFSPYMTKPAISANGFLRYPSYTNYFGF